MTSATTTPSRGAHGRRVGGSGYGLVLFAAILLFITGCFNLVDGIAAIANSHVFVAHAHYVFGNPRTWGWVTFILGALQMVAAVGVLATDQVAPLVRGGRNRAQRYRPDVLHSRLPILVLDHHCPGRGRALRAVRLRRPREHDRIGAAQGAALID